MTEMMQGLLAEAKNGRFSSIRESISEDDVASVWENVAAFIEKQMSQQKGVNVPNLGIFTFSQKKLEIGNNKFLLIQRPVFNVSEKFAQTHALHFTKYHAPGQIPVVPLNYAALSFESPFDRDTVESCFREIVNAINRAVSVKKNVEVLFAGIGRLSFRDSRVKMKFFKDFINQMDGSGKLVDSLQNRPGTVDSVISDRSLLSRSGTSNTIILPKISATQANFSNLPTLLEHEETLVPFESNLASNAPDIEPEIHLVEDEIYDINNVDTQIFDMSEPVPGIKNTDNIVSDILNTGEIEPTNNAFNTEIMAPDPLQDIQDEQRYIGPVSTSGSRLAMCLPKASGISLLDDLVPPCLTPKLMPGGTPQFRPPATPMVANSYPGPNVLNDGERHSPFPPRTPLIKPITPPHLAPLSRTRSAEPFSETKEVAFAENTKPSSACGHSNAGQEICYLCHQRANRNIPVSFNAERKRREEEEDLLLRQYQTLNDGEEMLREQDKLMSKRNDLQKIAAFNLGVADAVGTTKKKRDTDFHRSYVFQRRALTPPRFPKQDAYCRELQKQVDSKEKLKTSQKTDTDFLERLEQVQLAEDLATQREQYLQNKFHQQESYKKSLETQICLRDQFRRPDGLFRTPDILMRNNKSYIHEEPVSFLTVPRPNFLRPFNESRRLSGSSCSLDRLKFKPSRIQPAEADSEVFGLNDMNNEKMDERRRRAFSLFKEQQECVAQKKRDAILRRLAEQQEEERVLDNTKQELVEDRANRFSRRFKLRKDLEGDWFNAAQSRRAHELQDRLCNLHTGMLVHEQCDKYKRCKKCMRKVTNCGESNIWSESRYIPGSRLMV